jgi:hypothetical protein
MFASCLACRRLRVEPLAPSEESGGKNPGIVYDQQFIAAEQLGEIREAAVLPNARGAIQEQQA